MKGQNHRRLAPALPALVFVRLVTAAVGTSAQEEPLQQQLQDVVAVAVESVEGTWYIAAEDGTNRGIDLDEGVGLDFVDHATHGDSNFSVGEGDREALRVLLAPSSFEAHRIAIRLTEPLFIQGITKTMTLRLASPEAMETQFRIIVLDNRKVEYKIPISNSVSEGWLEYHLAIPPVIRQRSWGTGQSGLYFAGIEFVPREQMNDSITLFLGSVSAVVDMFKFFQDTDVPGNW
jgi:hypothetical protein